MRTHTRALGLAVLAVAASVALGSCGSSGSDKSETTTPAPVATAADESGATTPAVASGETTGGGGIALPVKDAAYASGRIHVEFGGDSGGAVEIDGSGVIIGGFANIAFSDTNNQASVIFGLGGDQPGAAVFTWDGITSGGEFGKQCTISFTKGDQTALEGEFSCSGMDGVKPTSTEALHVDATGTFRLAAGS